MRGGRVINIYTQNIQGPKNTKITGSIDLVVGD